MHMKKFPYYSPRLAVCELQHTSPLCDSADHEGFTLLDATNRSFDLNDLEDRGYED